ncbi:MAG: lysoplasmalogenase [bacterium]
MISPYPGRWLIKWLAIASLAVIVWQQRSSAQELWLAAGLLCHSIGDILLDLDRSQLFLPAVGAFLCGHVLYLVAFWPEAMAAPRLSSIPKALILTVVGFGLIVGRILIPHLPEMLLVPIVIYMLAICAMAITAIAANYSTIWVVAGAFLYLLSDALIGINTFVRPLSYSEYLIWPAYYFGQLLIALGFLRRNANEWTVA